MSTPHGDSGSRLTIEDVRREGFRILPLCPFAKTQFERYPELRDMLSA
jgi:predicted GNAT family acetyltransferase